MSLEHWLLVTQFNWDKVLQPNNWLTALFCVLLFLFTLLLVTFRRKMLLLFHALFSQRHFSLVQRDGKVLETRGSILLLLFDLLTLTAGLVMFCTTYLPSPMSKLPFVAYLGIGFVVLLSAYVLKLLANELYSVLFGRDKERAAVNQYKFIVMTDFSVLAFPMLLLVQYAGFRFLYYVLFAVLLVLLVIWLYRLMKINSMSGHGFHFFLYFCTLEILPWILLIKVLLIV